MNDIQVIARVAPAECWACKAPLRIVSSIELARGDDRVECSIADLTDYPALAGQIAQGLASDALVGAIKTRESHMAGRSYISNGCPRCDALYGQHYEIHARYDEADVLQFEAEGAGPWGTLMTALIQSDDGHLFHL